MRGRGQSTTKAILSARTRGIDLDRAEGGVVCGRPYGHVIPMSSQASTGQNQATSVTDDERRINDIARLDTLRHPTYPLRFPLALPTPYTSFIYP
jgi:hypothetical protein